MKRRFVLLVDGATKEQQNVITAFFKAEPTGYWHWFSDAWLITDPRAVWDAKSIRDKVRELVPTAKMLVLKVDDAVGWAGAGSKEMFKWMHETWKEK